MEVGSEEEGEREDVRGVEEKRGGERFCREEWGKGVSEREEEGQR